MKKLIARICFRLAVFFRQLGRKFTRQPAARQAIIDEWKRLDGDKTLRVEYDLNPSSIVFDFGGYEGEWAAEIAARYGCRVEVFEPYLPYANAIAKRFKNNPNINVHAFGLDRKYERLQISVAADATSIFKQASSRKSAEIELKEAKLFLEKGNFKRIHLMKINIEGGEYALLEHLLEEDWIKNIDNIQVQFHHFVPDARQRMEAIQAQLAKTHELTYQYDFLWENWTLK